MKKPLGRLAGAMFATAALALTFSPAALAQEGNSQQKPPTSGHGYINPDGRGVLVISCAAGAPANLETENLEALAGPDQDGAKPELWNYEVKLVGEVKGDTSKFSWKCDGKPGHGVVDIKKTPPTTTPPTTTTTPSTPSTTPSTSTTTPTTSTTTTKPVVKPQVKFTPQGGVETGFGGMAEN